MKGAQLTAASLLMLFGCIAANAYPTSMDQGMPTIIDGGGPVPPLMVAKLIQESDLVVLGSYTETVNKPGVATQLTLRVDRLIKGHLPGNVSILDLGERQTTRTLPVRYGVFFLSGSAEHFRRTDCRTLLVVAAPPEFQQLPASADPLTVVAAAISDVFTIPERITTRPEMGLNQFVSLVGNGPDSSLIPLNGQDYPAKWAKPTELRQEEEVYAAAAEALLLVPIEYKRPFLTAIVNSKGPLYGRVWAYAELAQSGNILQLDAITNYLVHPNENAALTNARIWEAFSTAPNVSEGLAPFFAKVLTSSNELVREGAMAQLGEMQSKVALRAMESALTVNNKYLRAAAIDNICRRTAACDPNQADELAKPHNIKRVKQILYQWEAGNP